MRIDGALALANINGFLQSVQAALAAMLAQDAKLTRFAASVPGGARTPPVSRRRARASSRR
jgi:hypothetical protein